MEQLIWDSVNKELHCMVNTSHLEVQPVKLTWCFFLSFLLSIGIGTSLVVKSCHAECNIFFFPPYSLGSHDIVIKPVRFSSVGCVLE